MKILISVFTYYPHSNGVQNVTQYQAEGLVGSGNDVTVLTGLRTDLNEKIVLPVKDEHNGVKIKRFDGYTDLMTHFGDKEKYQKMIINLSSKYDVIMFVCPESWCTDWAIPIVDKLQCASMMMVHGITDHRWSTMNDKSIRSLYAVMRKIGGNLRWPLFFCRNWDNIKKFDKIAHLHEKDFAYQYFERHGVMEQEVLYNAVDDEFFKHEAKRNRIINVGTFAPGKNQSMCLKTFYKTGLEDWELVLIGPAESDYYKNLLEKRKELEKKHGHRNVRMLVGIPRSKTIKYIRQSKIYMLTSISEMFPVSLIEGMAAGCAFVSTDVGIDRYLPGGLIGNTTGEMIGHLEYLAQNDTWAKYGSVGYRFAYDNCRRGGLVKKLENILEDAIESHNCKNC